MRAIDADRLLDRCKFYHLPNGDIAVPIIDVQHAPTIEIEPHWIPVTERLPEKYKHVLVTSRGGVSMAWYNGMYFEKGASTKHRAIQTAKAWMPLPKPYKGVTE